MKKDTSFKTVIHAISKFISWVIFIVLLAAAIFLLYYFIATKIYAARGPGYEPKFSIYTIASPSMTPVIKTYDAIINVKVNGPEDIKKGDIITFISSSILSSGMTITHRVIRITTDASGNTCYVTKGDFNNVEDQACAKYSNVIGKVVFKIPQLGRVQQILAKKSGWVFFILIPALYVICKDILKITKLTSIKSNTDKMTKEIKRDPKKEKEELQRKEELKRRLLQEQEDEVYYQEPVVRTINKTRSNKNKKGLPRD